MSITCWVIRGEDGRYLADTGRPDHHGYMREAKVAYGKRDALRFLTLEAAQRVMASQPTGWIVRVVRKATPEPSAAKEEP